MSIIHKAVEIIDNASRIFGRTLSWLAFFMVLLMFFNVISRYLLQTNLVWQQELVGFMHAILFLAAAGYTLLEDGHVRVDVFYHNFSDKAKAVINMVGTVMLLFPVCIVISYFSYEFIESSWQIKEASAEYNGMKGVYLLKSCIWIFTFSLILQGFSNILKAIITLKGNS